MVLLAVIANLMAAGCAMLLIRKGSTRRLRLLVLVVGLMSLGQTVLCLQATGVINLQLLSALPLHVVITAGLSLHSVYLLGLEVRERNLNERRMRLVEHELHSGETIKEGLNRLQFQLRFQLQLKKRKPAHVHRPSSALSRASDQPVEIPKPKEPTLTAIIHPASVQATSDLLTLFNAITAEECAALQDMNPELRPTFVRS